MKKFVVLVCFSLLSMHFLQAQSKVQQAINTLVKDPKLQHAQLSIAIMDVQSGQMIASHAAQKSLIPASIQKLFTTASALAMLRPEYIFKTDLQYDGMINSEGVLSGNIYLKGYGDPTLGSDQMDAASSLEEVLTKFSLAVQKKGIRRIEGRILGDASWLSSSVNGRGWPWIDLGNYYAAGAWGLNFHENLYYLRFRQRSRLGAIPPVAEIEPDIPGLTFKNEVKSASAKSGDNAYIYGAPRTYERVLRGTIPIGSRLFSIKGSIPDPPLFAAQQLQQQLQGVGIICGKNALNLMDRPVVEVQSSDRQTLYTHQSPTLASIVHRANLKSVNLYCEALIRAIGREIGGEGSAEEGIKQAAKYWKERGLATGGCFFQDGSGLAKSNAAPSQFFVDLLSAVAKNKRIFPDLYASLPIAGQSGGMRYALRGTAAAGKVRAKTGTLNRVRSLAGYIDTRAGRRLAFCIIVNNYTGSGGVIRKKMESLLLAAWEEH